jgi:hypothetical protein
MKSKVFTLRGYLFSILALFFCINIAQAVGQRQEAKICGFPATADASQFTIILWYTYNSTNSNVYNINSNFDENQGINARYDEQNFINKISGKRDNKNIVLSRIDETHKSYEQWNATNLDGTSKEVSGICVKVKQSENGNGIPDDPLFKDAITLNNIPILSSNRVFFDTKMWANILKRNNVKIEYYEHDNSVRIYDGYILIGYTKIPPMDTEAKKPTDNPSTPLVPKEKKCPSCTIL